MKHTPINTATVATSDLLAALAFTARAADRCASIPVLSRVVLRGHGDRLVIAGTDLDIEARVTTDATTTGDLAVTICPRLARMILQGGDGTTSITATGDQIAFTNGDIGATFNHLIPVEDWPVLIPDDADLTEVAEIGESDLHRALTQVAPCISTEKTRYYLNGAFLTVQDGHLRMVSTDGHRLAIYDLPATPWADSTILPTRTVKLLQSRLRAGGNSAVRVSGIGATHLIFDGPDWRIASKLIDGTFPDYTRVLPPDDRARDFTLSRAAPARIPNVSAYGAAVKIDADAGHAEAQIDGPNITVRLPVTGRGGTIGFNHKYLRAFAAASPSGTIRLTGKAGSGDPHRVTHDDPAFLGVLMPMRV